MRAWTLGACFLMAVGCTTRPATQIVVEIDAESGVRADLDVVHVLVNGGDGSTVGAPGIQRLDVRERPPRWPFTVVIAPLDRDPERRYEVVVTAEGAQPAVGERPVTARVRAISGFVPGETRILRLLLEDACRGQLCGDDQTCRRGDCQSANVDPATLASERDAGPRGDVGSGMNFTPRNLPSTVWSNATGTIAVMTSGSIDTDSGVVLVDGMSSRDFDPIDIDPVGECAGIFTIATGEFRVAAGATVTVTGSRALAIAATGPIVIDGTLDVGAHGTVPGPGGLRRRAGGSYGTDGAFNGACSPPVGILPTHGDTLLTGLCGGSASDAVGSGGAGGAVELASLVAVHIGAAGVVRAVGGGGSSDAGGSGGGVLIAAPEVHIAGIVTVNGGGGGAAGFSGPLPGQDGLAASQATGAMSQSMLTCPACGQSSLTASGGAGAWQDGPATAGAPGWGCTCSDTVCRAGGGGGGGAGRIRIDATVRDYVEGRVLEYPALTGVLTEGTL